MVVNVCLAEAVPALSDASWSVVVLYYEVHLVVPAVRSSDPAGFRKAASFDRVRPPSSTTANVLRATVHGLSLARMGLGPFRKLCSADPGQAAVTRVPEWCMDVETRRNGV